MPRLLANCELEAVNCPSEGMAFLGLSGDAATDRHGLVHSQHRTAARSPSAGAHVGALTQPLSCLLAPRKDRPPVRPRPGHPPQAPRPRWLAETLPCRVRHEVATPGR